MVGKRCSSCAQKSKPTSQPWKPKHSTDGANLSDDDFDYEDFIEREFGRKPHRKTGLKWYWWILAVLTLIGMIYRVSKG
jgi:hypothetical protein